MRQAASTLKYTIQLLCLLAAVTVVAFSGDAVAAPADTAKSNKEVSKQETTAQTSSKRKKVVRGFDGQILSEAEQQPRLIRIRAGLTQLVGQGSFSSGVGANESVISQFNVQPYLDFQGWNLFANMTLTWEYTDPDNAAGRRLTVFDPSIGARTPIRLDAINSSVWLSGGLRLPVSHMSRAQGTVTRIFLGGVGNWRSPIPGLSARLGLNGQLSLATKDWREVEEDSEFEDRALGKVPVASCAARTGDNSADACGALPNLATLSGNLGMGYALGKFSFDLDVSVLSFINAYGGAEDEFTSGNARTGVNASTFTTSRLAVTYFAKSWMAVAAGVNSFQPIQTADGKNMRFPLWNFDGSANNFSNLFASATFRY